MSQEKEIIEMIVNSIAFKTTIGTTIATLTTWFLVKVKNSPTKKDLEKIKKEAFDYTDDKLKVHEDKQVLELINMSTKIDETHVMVGKLLDIQLNKK